MPKLLSESLKRARARASRIRDSIGSSKIDEAPGLFAETSAEDRSAMSTILNGSTESLGTVAPAIVVSESQQGDPIPGSQSRTSLHLQEPDTFASDLFPSTNDSSARSGAPSGASQIKVNQVQDDPFKPLLELLRHNKVLQEIEPSLHEDPDEGVYQAFVDAVQKCYEQNHNSCEEVIGTKVYNIKVDDTAKQEVSIVILEGETTFTSVYFYLVGKSIGNPKTEVRHRKYGLKAQHVRKGKNEMSAEAVLAEIERREHVIKPAMAATSDGRVAWVLRRSGDKHQDFGWFYDVHGLISEGDRGLHPT